MPRIVTRYILVESLHYIAISLFAFTALLLTLRMIKFASLIINKGVEFGQILSVFLAIIPTFLEIAIPMSALLGIMLAFARLSGDSEIVVMRASGISLRQLLAPVVVLGLALAAACFYVSLVLKPAGYQYLAKSLFEIARSRSTAGLSAGVFNSLGRITLYADRIDHQTGELDGVVIDDRRGESERKLILAKSGRILSHEQDRNIVFFLRSGEIHEILEGKYVLTDFSENKLLLSTDELYETESGKDDKAPREMPGPELRKSITRYREIVDRVEEDPSVLSVLFQDAEMSPRRVQKRLRNMEIELARRYSMPFAAFILALLAMPLGVQPPRTQKTWGAALSASLGMLVFVLYYALLSVGVAFAENGTIPGIVGVWLPNVVCTLLALYTLSQMSSERWQSIGHAFEVLARRVGRLFNPVGAR